MVALGLYGAFWPNTGKAFGIKTPVRFLFIRTGSDYEKLKSTLVDEGLISNMYSFSLMAKLAKLPAHIHPGKYKITEGMNNYNIIRMLHTGKQVQVNLVINKLRTKQDFVNLIATNLEADSATLKNLLADNEFLSQYGLDSSTAMCAVIPNTYFFKWTTPADKAFRKIAENYSKFWDAERLRQAKEQGLTPVKATIIASIVDEETNISSDKPNIASVYLNRLKKGMKLQADPTVKFAIGDFAIKRVTGAMLQINSPFNTYMYEGLPPGPICTPSLSSMQAVLEAPKTTYLYFCAKDDLKGYTAFASTYEEQTKNARAYQKALDERGIH